MPTNRTEFGTGGPDIITANAGEQLTAFGLGGNDTIFGGAGLSALVRLTLDGGDGNDTLSGGNGADTLIGGVGNDTVDGNQGNDTALLGSGNDTFVWDPGDGSDVVEGQDGSDTLLFNGSVGALTKEFKMSAKVGETVRVYFGVGGPNKVSSFHVIGEIFDKVYSEGSPTTVKNDVQTTLVAPGGATMVEFKLNYPGKYLLVDHALSRVGKGLVGTLDVSGVADAAIYQPIDGAGDAHQH